MTIRPRCGAIAAALAAFAMAAMLAPAQRAQAQEAFIGEVRFFAGNFAPRGWAFCNGQLLSISQNQALFSILGTTYGGDGRTTFALPNAQGRAIVHPGSDPGLPSVRLGERGGRASTTLTEAQMPAHTHSATTTSRLRAFNGGGDQENPANRVLADDGSDRIYSDQAPDTDMSSEAVVSTTTVNSAGASQPVDIRSPYTAVNCIIALVGIFPSRN